MRAKQEGREGGRRISIPFGRQDATVFRKVMSAEDTIQAFVPVLRVALQMLGGPYGFGISYFDFDNARYVKTATEVSRDNSALMCNIRKHENALQVSLATNKAQDMAEVAAGLMGLSRARRRPLARREASRRKTQPRHRAQAVCCNCKRINAGSLRAVRKIAGHTIQLLIAKGGSCQVAIS